MSTTAASSRFSPERLTTFSDAVVAIGITLLTIDLRLDIPAPTPTVEADLERGIEAMTGPILAFALSFIVIAIWWNGHRRLFDTLEAADGTLVAINFAFLAGIAFLPFPTSVIGRFGDQPAAVILYAATIVELGAASLAMPWHARRAGLFDADVDLPGIARRLRMIAITPLVFLVSMPVAVVAPAAAMLSWNVAWLAMLILRRRWRHVAAA